MSGYVVLVTGAGSGFGRLTAEALTRRGHTVFAGLRDVTGRNAQAAADLSASMRVVELDVTEQASADRAVSEIMSAAGRIDVVVNNAGMIFPGPLEAFTAEEAQRQFDVNVLGALRVNRAALPHLRARGQGLLLQIGSIAGLVTTPFTGLYAASKAALESLTEAWRHELAPFGIESVIVDAASYPTSIGLNAALPADTERLSVYGEAFGGFTTAVVQRSTEIGGDPREVADAVVKLIESDDRPLRTVVGPAGQREPALALSRASAETAEQAGAAMGVAAFMTR
ncbi:short-chain dehydrogenase/reductase [Paractinoplanes abujensis]|uniref:NAD(P)-dependent dehydrogenase (Short-subunit alcohol dehydrogenase family) n=1 Tax=Paractinoplanes abujensis TaxID=882441 RepID=A0A7W7G3V2_9ACTN|nr:SDR family oxidoreductase [Actinoplanes abujensis]MBB4695004.1 NAD(P)-dependent dehydrogenase (short-subunit alcohol dehydrogenase family) [Actinoplanes abujensis]GID23736.1 short-chain dehydrogenase/reductase [Actinoplanes abujensis]